MRVCVCVIFCINFIRVHVTARYVLSVFSRRVLSPRVHYGDKASIEVLPAPQIKSHRETFCEHAAPADPHHPAGARLPSTSPPKSSPPPTPRSTFLISLRLIYSLLCFPFLLFKLGSFLGAPKDTLSHLFFS